MPGPRRAARGANLPRFIKDYLSVRAFRMLKFFPFFMIEKAITCHRPSNLSLVTPPSIRASTKRQGSGLRAARGRARGTAASRRGVPPGSRRCGTSHRREIRSQSVKYETAMWRHCNRRFFFFSFHLVCFLAHPQVYPLIFPCSFTLP